MNRSSVVFIGVLTWITSENVKEEPQTEIPEVEFSVWWILKRRLLLTYYHLSEEVTEWAVQPSPGRKFAMNKYTNSADQQWGVESAASSEVLLTKRKIKF